MAHLSKAKSDPKGNFAEKSVSIQILQNFAL